MLDTSDSSRKARVPSVPQDLDMTQKTEPSIQQPTRPRTFTVKILPCKRKPEASSEHDHHSNDKTVSSHNGLSQPSPVSDKADLGSKGASLECLDQEVARKERKKKSSQHHHRADIHVREESQLKESDEIECQSKGHENPNESQLEISRPNESQLKRCTKPNSKYGSSISRISKHNGDACSKNDSSNHEHNSLPVSPTQHKILTNVDPLQGLTTYIETLGGSLGGGWRAEQGKLCKIYFSPTNRKFNARTQVARYLGLPLHYRKYADRVKNANGHARNEIKHEAGHARNEIKHEVIVPKSKESDDKSLKESGIGGPNHPEQSIASIYEGPSEKLDQMQIFKAYIEGLGGSLEEGWRVEPHKTYNTYYSPNGMKFTARTQVARYLGLLSLFRRKKTKVRSRRGNRKIKSILADIQSGRAKFAGDNIYNKANESSQHKTEKFLMNSEGQDCANQGQNVDSTKVHLQGGEYAARSMSLTTMNGNKRCDLQLGKQDSPSGILVTERCQDVFQSIISAENFASLGNMLSRALPCGYSGDTSQFKNSAHFGNPLGLQLISFRLSTGAYGKSPELFAEDIQRIWSDVAAMGNSLVSLATSLSKLSDSLYKEQVSSLFQIEDEGKPAGSSKHLTSETNLVTEKLQEKQDPADKAKTKADILNPSADAKCRTCGVVGNADSYRCRKCNALYHTFCATNAMKDLPMSDKWCCPSCVSSSETQDATSDQGVNKFELMLPSTSLSNDESSETDREKPCRSICKVCGKKDEPVLFCESCDAAYHMKCVLPPINSLPDSSWCCPECEAKKNKSNEKGVDKKDHHCVVCERIHNESLEVPFGQENLDHIQSESLAPFGQETLENAPINNRSMEVSVASSSAKDQGHNTPKIESSCKLCGISDGNGVVHCAACTKCYHLSCLRPALRNVTSPGVWYCPSCLCCECRIDVDDEKILLCDGCDEGYHMYCLFPPVKKIPRGLWFCSTCTLGSRNHARVDENGLVISPKNSKKVSRGKRKYSELSQANGV